MFLIFLILIFGVSESVLSASPTRFPERRPHINNNNEELQDSLVMSNLIGSGGLNFQHYFYTLGVACENRNPGFWNTVDKVIHILVRYLQGWGKYIVKIQNGIFVTSI